MVALTKWGKAQVMGREKGRPMVAPTKLLIKELI